jgi:hypothetical protein
MAENNDPLIVAAQPAAKWDDLVHGAVFFEMLRF